MHGIYFFIFCFLGDCRAVSSALGVEYRIRIVFS